MNFPTTNNEVEYKALIVELGLDKNLRAKNIKACGDSRLVFSQVNEKFEARDNTIAKNLKMVKAVMTQFNKCHIEYIPREENGKGDVLSKFASSEGKSYVGSVYFQVLKAPSINLKLITPVETESCWMDPNKNYLEIGWLPSNVKEARKLIVWALRFALIEGIFFKKFFTITY